MEDTIYACFSEFTLFRNIFMHSAVELIYRFQEFAEILDAHGNYITLHWEAQYNAFCGQVPKPDVPL